MLASSWYFPVMHAILIVSMDASFHDPRFLLVSFPVSVTVQQSPHFSGRKCWEGNTAVVICSWLPTLNSISFFLLQRLVSTAEHICSLARGRPRSQKMADMSSGESCTSPLELFNSIAAQGELVRSLKAGNAPKVGDLLDSPVHASAPPHLHRCLFLKSVRFSAIVIPVYCRELFPRS